MKGCTKVGLFLLVFTVRPMRVGATLMNDMLFNTALVLLATNAVIQFCAQAFALYANETAIHDIWGDQVILFCHALSMPGIVGLSLRYAANTHGSSIVVRMGQVCRTSSGLVACQIFMQLSF